MKKLICLLIISTIVMSIISVLLFYQLTNVQSLNNDLKDQNNEIQNQLSGEKNHNLQLENQIIDLEDQITQLESQLIELPIENNQLKVQILELEQRVDELENPVYDVEITSFSVEETWNNPGGLLLLFDTTIIIKNFGNIDVTGLVIFLKRIGDVNNLLGSGYKLLDTLHAGEEMEINTWIETSIDLAWKHEPIIHIATLRLGTLIVDEYRIS